MHLQEKYLTLTLHKLVNVCAALYFLNFNIIYFFLSQSLLCKKDLALRLQWEIMTKDSSCCCLFSFPVWEIQKHQGHTDGLTSGVQQASHLSFGQQRRHEWRNHWSLSGLLLPYFPFWKLHYLVHFLFLFALIHAGRVVSSAQRKGDHGPSGSIPLDAVV